jgi:hypothetical protein
MLHFQCHIQDSYEVKYEVCSLVDFVSVSQNSAAFRIILKDFDCGDREFFPQRW